MPEHQKSLQEEPKQPTSPEQKGQIEAKTKALQEKKQEQALERFNQSLLFPKTVGQYPSEDFDLKKNEERKMCEQDLCALLGVPKGQSLSDYVQEGKRSLFDDRPQDLIRTSEIQYAGKPFLLKSAWREIGEGKSNVTLTLGNNEPRLFVFFDEKGTITRISQSRDPYNVWGQIAADRNLGINRYCKPGSKELQNYYKARGESERTNKPPETYDAKPEEIKKIIFVPTGQVKVADMSTPLATDFLWVCTGLSVVDPVRKRHLLAHVSGHSNADDGNYATIEEIEKLEKILKGFTMDKSQVTIAIGDSEESIARQLFLLLQKKYGIPSDRIRIIPPRFINNGRGSGRGEDILFAPEKEKAIYRAMNWDTERKGPVFEHLNKQRLGKD